MLTCVTGGGTIMKQFTVGKNDAGQRLDRFVAKCVPALPQSLAQKYIRIKRIKIGGKGSKLDYRLCVGDVVQMYVNDEYFADSNVETANVESAAYKSVAAPALDIVYEDDNILLANKEAGVLCHSDGAYGYGCLVSRVQAYLHQKGEWRPSEENSFAPALCNRIDRNTSGIVIAAKNAESMRIINEKIKLREIDKYYLAAVHGIPNPPDGRLEGYIFKDSVKNQVYVTAQSRPGSKTATTEYRTLQTAGQLALLECRLITGRTHQIRAQLAAAGHPLLGDGKYGSERMNKQYGERHQALCSYKLVFAFKSDAMSLSYLKWRSFELKNIQFIQKYFPSQ